MTKLLASYNRVDIAFLFHSQEVPQVLNYGWVYPDTHKNLSGFKFFSRTTLFIESINHNVNMSDWIANNENFKKGHQILQILNALSKIKKNLRQIAHRLLFNASLFAEQFKDAVWKMWKDFI